MATTISCLRRTRLAYPEAGAPTVIGKAFPATCEIIEVHVKELAQLFNAIDPSPFREKDLDSNAEEFIVAWAREASPDARLALLVHLDKAGDAEDDEVVVGDALHEFFRHRAEATRQRLNQLFQVGRKSLLIGLTFLAVSIGVSDVATALTQQPLGDILHESYLIGGWVAMWRPMEIFLYDWWPIRADARLFQRLAEMPVSVADSVDAASQYSAN